MYRRDKYLMYYFSVVITILFTGCGHNYTRSDIVGTWVSPKGGTLIFSEHVAEANAIPRYVISSQLYAPSNNSCSGKGTWYINVNNNITLELAPIFEDNDGSIVEKSFEQPMGIKGKGSSLCIFYTIGDPDNMDYYEFYRRTP